MPVSRETWPIETPFLRIRSRMLDHCATSRYILSHPLAGSPIAPEGTPRCQRAATPARPVRDTNDPIWVCGQTKGVGVHRAPKVRAKPDCNAYPAMLHISANARNLVSANPLARSVRGAAQPTLKRRAGR